MTRIGQWLAYRASPLPANPPRWQLLLFWAAGFTLILIIR